MTEPTQTRLSGEGLTRRVALLGLGGALAAGHGAILPRTTLAQADATPTAVPPDFKVVLHAAEEQDWVYVLSNLRNLTAEWPQAHLRVVVDGSAVLTLQGQNVLTKELDEVVAKGVELLVCPNALHEHEIDPATIPAYAKTTLGGVVALVMSQHDGYAYVKP